MKRLLSATILLLYTACSVMLAVEHVRSSAATFAKARKAPGAEVRSYSPDAAQKRLVEDPFTVSQDPTTFALKAAEANTARFLHSVHVNDVYRIALSRGPPAFC